MKVIINADVFEVLYIKAIVLKAQFEYEKQMYIELDTDLFDTENDYINFSNMMRDVNSIIDNLQILVCKIRTENNINIRQSTMETVAENVCAEYHKITDLIIHNKKLKNDIVKICKYLKML